MSASLTDRQREAVAQAVIGPYIGGGVARTVYEHAFWPEWVVKVETEGTRDFQNIAEYDLWKNARPKLAKFLAPCIWLSADGLVLIQEKCEPIPEHMVPVLVPALLTDTHPGNWGWLAAKEGKKGRVVMFDYGRHLALHIAQNMALKETERWSSASRKRTTVGS